VSNKKQAEETRADQELPIDDSNEIEHTPTDESGDETQRNEESSTEDGVGDRLRRDRHKRPRGDGTDSSGV